MSGSAGWFDTEEQARAACPGAGFVLVHDGRYEPFRRYRWVRSVQGWWDR